MNKEKGTKVIYLDIMVNGKFHCQVPMIYSPLFAIDTEQARKYVLEKKPYLRGKDFTIAFSSNRVLKR